MKKILVFILVATMLQSPIGISLDSVEQKSKTQEKEEEEENIEAGFSENLAWALSFYLFIYFAGSEPVD